MIMGITITKLKMWKNPGYTKGCVEVPPLGSKKLPTPDYTNTTNLRPRKNGTINAIELPLSFCQVFDMSYLYMEFSDSSNRQVNVFGWIDSIEQTASSEEAVLIRWDVDWWRTYSGSVTFGSGRVLRSGSNVGYNHIRPYEVHPRKWTYGYSEKIESPGAITNYPLSIIVTYSKTITSPTPHTTQIVSLCFPIMGHFNATRYSATIGGTTYYAPSTDEVFRGEVDELLGLDSDSITAIYLSPILPCSDPNYIHAGAIISGVHMFAYVVKPGYLSESVSDIQLMNTYYSNDDLKTVIMDPYGAIVYTMPWGYSAKYLSYSIDIGTTSAYLLIALSETDQLPLFNRGQKYSTEGLLMSIPLITIPFNSNAYTSYVYSGQREYDIRLKEIQRDQELVKGFTSIGTNAVTGAVGGAMVGSAPGAVAGGVIGAGGSLITTGANYLISAIADDEIQEATDKLYSNQASSIIQGGGGHGFLNNLVTPGGWYIVQMLSDTVSSSEHVLNITTYGANIDVVTPNVALYIPSPSDTCGGVKIDNLTVTGAVPPEAKQYIRNKFASGLILVENNPSGVAP